MSLLFKLDQTCLPIYGCKSMFPVRRIYCVGRNYLEHIREMDGNEREPPFFFLKPSDTIIQNECDFKYPPMSNNVHHEIELVVAIDKKVKNISASNALDCVFGYGVGIDMTRRDLQSTAKKMRRPWSLGKSFDQSAPCSPIRTVLDSGHPSKGRIWLAINGEIRQDGDLSHQIWNVSESIAYLSNFFEIFPGDLIFTGTPAGVGPVEVGDEITGGIENVGELKLTVR